MTKRFTIQITSGQGSRITRVGSQPIVLQADEIFETDDAGIVAQLRAMPGLTIREYDATTATEAEKPPTTPAKRVIRPKG